MYFFMFSKSSLEIDLTVLQVEQKEQSAVKLQLALVSVGRAFARKLACQYKLFLVC